MRYLILSDIHANVTALDSVLAAARGQWDKAVCLGDVVGYGPDPNQAVERIRSLNLVTIRGNHDKAGSGLANADDFNPIARAVAMWTKEQLSPENRDWLQKLPGGPLVINDFRIVHGAIHDEDEYVFSPAQALDGLLETASPVTFFGHTHLQGGFTFRDNQVGVLSFRPTGGQPFSTLSIETGTTYLLNPGSIGQPRDGDPRAAFAIADLAKNSVEFWRVTYNIEAVQNRMVKAGLPEPLILRLSFGR